ncbi:hypothetical protein [Vibrio algarum]|uniref:Uncharacterized protein n=1 Tax=Vibrio algarum TaxID=3020714 RepID=A0ABT4YR14_9VIBR|nr:hypothetical protein [Vibrio sp. KJ40-1]MDB1124001.1 hypothetical protein [Vibrio sp. KJ40-1]
MKSMKLTAVVLLTGLLFGCNTELRDKTGTETEKESKSPLLGGYWELGNGQSALRSTKSGNLPNVYVFEGTSQKYYNDDENFGSYTIYPSSMTEDIDGKKLSFKYHSNDSDPSDTTDVTGIYSVSSGNLVISGTNLGELAGVDHSDDTLISAAILTANKEAGDNNVVHILDTNNLGTNEDTGELRIKLVDSTTVSEITSGKLTVDVIYQEDADTTQEADGTSDNAYISLYASGTSTSYLHGEVALEKGSIKYRDASKTLTETGGTFKLGETLNVEITWEPNSFSFSVNGVEYVTGGAVTDGTAVTTIALRLGSNGDTTNYELMADNLVVYSNDSGNETIVLEESFDSYAAGLDLSTVYNSSTNEATILTEAGGAEEPTDPTDPSIPQDVADDFESYTVGSLISEANSDWITANIKDNSDGLGTTTAEVTDRQAAAGTQSLYLADNHTGSKPFAMRAFSAPASSGSVSLNAYFPSTNSKSTYINIGNGKNNANRYFELNQSGTNLKYESGDSDITLVSNLALDTWHTLTLTWTDAGLVTVAINGDIVAKDIEQSTTGLDSTIVPSQLTLVTGDNSGNSNIAYFDNLDSELF